MSFYKVSPGDNWRPDSVRENAITDILNSFSGARQPPLQYKASSTEIVRGINISNVDIKAGSIVQIAPRTEGRDSITITRPYPSDIFVDIKPIQSSNDIWGIAQSFIPSKKVGLLQISGVALVEVRGSYEVTLNDQTQWQRKVRQNFVRPGLDGLLHYSTRGSAEVLWTLGDDSACIVKLGVRSNDYDGMFAVIENGDGTLTVRGGETDLIPGYAGNNMGFIKDTVIPVEYDKFGINGRFISLVAKWKNQQWELEVVSSKDGAQVLYIPGEQICWELARYDGVERDGKTLKGFQQLWTGGVINFRDRYFING